MDETYTKVRGEWAYLYRAVNRDGMGPGSRQHPKLTNSNGVMFYAGSDFEDIELLTSAGCSRLSSLETEISEYNRLFRVSENTGFDDVGLQALHQTKPQHPFWILTFFHGRNFAPDSRLPLR